MSMTMGPTAPEPATEGKDLSGGFLRLRISDGTHSHAMRIHVAPFTVSGGSLLYVTPPAGLFSDAGPDVTAGELIPLLQPFYTSGYNISLEALYQMVAGQPVEVWPTPTVASANGTAAATSGLTQVPWGQTTITTRDTAGLPFRVVLLSTANFTPSAPFPVADNGAGNGYEKLVHFLVNDGAIRSHAGNKPVAPMRAIFCLNERLRRAYHVR